MQVENLLFSVPKKSVINDEKSKIVRVSADFYNLLITIANETNLSNTAITQKISEFIINKIEFKEEG